MDQRIAATGSTIDSAGEDLRASVDDLEQRLEATRAATGSLETRLADASDRSDLEARVDDLRTIVDNQRTLITALQDSFSALENTAEDERGALGARIATLEDFETGVGERLDALSQTLDATRSRSEQLASRQQAVSSSVDSLTQRQAALADQVDQQGEAGAGNDAIEGLAATVQTLQGSMTRLEDQVDSLSSRETPSAADVASLKGGLIELRQGQTALSAAVEGVQTRVSNLPSGVSRDQIREIRERLESLDASRAQLTRRVTSLMTDVANLQRGGG
ncbi:hypothetical protein [Salinicola aestuarinus]|uniref:hypothetical protein n=1 Tax=Salinicola aestuarinus TaxID=1949082 RepID=UPI000DA209C2|nr:hypothetical protein [Salinicola aestuarinus]